MTSKCKVSVIMASYNEEEYIGEAIESILSQNFENFELIIVDDGSTDLTVPIIESYASDDSRIKLYVNESNEGLPSSLNTGIKNANGKYIARMDADDRSLNNRLTEQVRFLDANTHTHVVGCDIRFIGKNGSQISSKNYSTGAKDPETQKQDKPDVAHPSVMMRRSSLLAVNGYREVFDKAQDLDLWVRLIRKFGSGIISIIPHILFEYRLTPTSIQNRQIARIYDSYAGDLIGCEEELQNQITSDLESEDITTQDNKNRTAYHFRVGKLLYKQNISRSLIHFYNSAKNSPILFIKKASANLIINPIS